MCWVGKGKWRCHQAQISLWVIPAGVLNGECACEWWNCLRREHGWVCSLIFEEQTRKEWNPWMKDREPKREEIKRKWCHKSPGREMISSKGILYNSDYQWAHCFDEAGKYPQILNREVGSHGQLSETERGKIKFQWIKKWLRQQEMEKDCRNLAEKRKRLKRMLLRGEVKDVWFFTFHLRKLSQHKERAKKNKHPEK